jgi:hypothetical protein
LFRAGKGLIQHRLAGVSGAGSAVFDSFFEHKSVEYVTIGRQTGTRLRIN